MNKKYLAISILIFSCLIAGGILVWRGDIFSSQNAWKTYKNDEIGISFKYPSEMEKVENGFDISLSTKEGSSVSRGIDFKRYFGFGSQGNIENVMKQIGHPPSLKVIKENGVDAVVGLNPSFPEGNRLYVIVDDALFDVYLYNVDPSNFLKTLKITKAQAVGDYKVFFSGTYKTVKNQKYGYQVDIPLGLGISLNNEGVTFSEPYYFETNRSELPSIFIKVEPATVKLAQDAFWNGFSKFEKAIKVDKVNAGLGRLVESSEIKEIIVIKNSLMYTIIVQNYDYEKVLAGFKFLK